jgi:hypothetical protein
MPSTSCMEANRKGYAVLIPFLSRNRAPAGRGIRVLVPILSVFLGSCDVTPEYLRQGLQEQRLEEVGLPEVEVSPLCAPLRDLSRCTRSITSNCL